MNSSAFQVRKGPAVRRAAVSLAFLGELGRNPMPSELSFWTRKLGRGASITSMGNSIASTLEFKNLSGYTDTFVWDALAHQIEPAVDPLSRLAVFDSATGNFDEPVTAGSIVSTASKPVDPYILVHGWAPGFTQEVLTRIDPGDPLKWWQTSDSSWLLNGVTNISTEGLAQSILQGDPNAEVVAFSWIDQSATASGSNITTTGKLTARRRGRPEREHSRARRRYDCRRPGHSSRSLHPLDQ